MRDLLHDPIWRAAELGFPLPDSPHACSVAMPLWDHVVGYEEGRPEVVDALQCGYPRFVLHPQVRRLNDEARRRFNGEALVFPTEAAAQRCVEHLQRKGIGQTRREGFGVHDLTAVVAPEIAREVLLRYWCNCGEIVSSRQAQAALEGSQIDGSAAQTILRAQLAQQSGQPVDHVFLFPSGMAAMFAVHRMLRALFPQRKTAQLEFPYVDVLQVQQHFGPGVHFFAQTDEAVLSDLLAAEPLAGVLVELPSNPLMRCPALDRVAAACSRHAVPLVVDDTIATSINIDPMPFADVVTTSLTKYFSGTGDVMGGSVIVRADGHWATDFLRFLRAEPCMLWGGDAQTLERNARDYPERMQRFNANGARLFDYFRSRPELEQLHFVGGEAAQNFRALQRPGAGFGSLFSLVLKRGASAAAAFYDALPLCKGPSLGTNFTLACPYTLLAHYRELDWAEQCGVDRNLIRISVGLEDPDLLIDRFNEAFAACPPPA